MDWLDLLAVQGTLKSLLQHHSSKASVLRCSAFFIVQLSHPYMTTGKTIALTRQIFVDKVMSLLFNMLSGGGNEDNGDRHQQIPGMYCYTQCPQPCSRPPPTRASTRDSWTLPGKSGSVSGGVTAPFSWVLVCTSFCLCPSRVYFPVLCKFWQLYGGVNGDLLQEGLCHTQV